MDKGLDLLRLKLKLGMNLEGGPYPLGPRWLGYWPLTIKCEAVLVGL